ncbi:MAG: hypothetical protein H2056_02120 [Sphingopyxis sp.]|nr:hypothetical protein [Sphingopyxis sp.]
MRMMGNWDVAGGASDFWAYIREPRPHRWAFAGLACALAGFVLWGFSEKLIRHEAPKASVVYFENWSANRSDTEIRADWIARAKETTRRNAERRLAYQKLADSLGIEYDSAEADQVTRETLGAAAAEIGKRPAVKRSTLAERAARGAPPAP